MVNCTDTPERPGEATTAQTPALAAGKLLDFATPEGVRGHSATATGNLLTDTPVARRGVAFAESVSVKEVTPRKGPEAGDRLYSEADVQQKIADALKQAHQEAMIVQMETEELQKKLEAEMQNNKEMTTVVEEYSRALSDMIAQQNKTGADEAMANLKREKEQTEDDLRKTETAFSDLHAKYSKSKELMDNYRLNEQKLKETLISAQEALQASEKRYETLKGHAEAKISEANVEIANVREQYKTQINLLTVKAKKAESEIVSVRKQLEIKVVRLYPLFCLPFSVSPLFSFRSCARSLYQSINFRFLFSFIFSFFSFSRYLFYTQRDALCLF